MKKYLIVFLLTVLTVAASGQRLAFKGDLIEAAMWIPNLGIETKTGGKTTLDISAAYNPFQISDTKKWKLWTVQPEFRYWLCEAFTGSFLGVHAGVGQFNMGGFDGRVNVSNIGGLNFTDLIDTRVQGSFLNAGFSYGYQMVLSSRWSMEGNIGVGYARYGYVQYRCLTCGERVGSGTKNYFGPTRASIALVYMIR